MCAAGILPHRVFLVLNLPFGALYVYRESCWVRTHYLIFGQTVGDPGSGVVFLSVVPAPSICTFILFEQFRKKYIIKNSG
jgi:hypothetical protein